jgi:hypothetical protein
MRLHTGYRTLWLFATQRVLRSVRDEHYEVCVYATVLPAPRHTPHDRRTHRSHTSHLAPPHLRTRDTAHTQQLTAPCAHLTCVHVHVHVHAHMHMYMCMRMYLLCAHVCTPPPPPTRARRGGVCAERVQIPYERYL